MAGGISLQSNQMFRGETISEDDPGISLALSVDDRSGLFAGADVEFAAGAKEPRFTASNQYAGYALRKGKVSLEAGVIHRNYASIYDEAYTRGFFEIYAGATIGKLHLRGYVSPDYMVDGRTSYYLEANARLATVAGWRIDGHAGLSLIPRDLDDPKGGLADFEDWSLQASHSLGKFNLSLGLAATNYPVFGPSGKVRATAVLSRSF